MQQNIFLLLLISLFWSCEHNNNTENQTTENQETISEQCECFNGIGATQGDKPIYDYSFSNNQSIAICGYQKEAVISEFDVFSCKDGSSIAQYNALQNCKIEFKEDTIEITELKHLPSSNWEIKLLPIKKELIVLIENAIKAQGQTPYFIQPDISIEQQNAFLDEITNTKNPELQKDWNWEMIVAKLEVLSLMQNPKAEQTLLEIQTLTNHTFDGAVMEQYKHAIANIEWIKSRKSL